MSAINHLPEAAKVQGIAMYPTGDPKTSWVTVQYLDKNSDWHELKMPLEDSLYLLHLLAGMVQENGLQEAFRRATKPR